MGEDAEGQVCVCLGVEGGAHFGWGVCVRAAAAVLWVKMAQSWLFPCQAPCLVDCCRLTLNPAKPVLFSFHFELFSGQATLNGASASLKAAAKIEVTGKCWCFS